MKALLLTTTMYEEPAIAKESGATHTDRLKSIVARFPFLRSLVLNLKMNLSGSDDMSELADDECDVSPGTNAKDINSDEITEYIKVKFRHEGAVREVEIPVNDAIKRNIRIGGGVQRIKLKELMLSKSHLLSRLAH